MLYAEWCLHAKEFIPILEEVAFSFKHLNDKFVFAIFDSHLNDLEGVPDHKSSPSILMY